jgi:hypothetical protein
VLRLTALTAALALLVGCSSVDSGDIRTHGMKARFLVSVSQGADAAEVSAGLKVGTLTFVDLDKGEKLSASSADASTELHKRNALGVTDYYGRLPGVTAAGTEVVVGLARTGKDDSAPRSVVKLAEPVSFAAPAVGTQFSRRQGIVVRLETKPTDEPTEVNWHGDCVQTGAVQVSGDTARIAPGTVRRATPPPGATPGTKVPETCTVTLTVVRRTRGDVDPAFGGGDIYAEANATREISSRP